MSYADASKEMVRNARQTVDDTEQEVALTDHWLMVLEELNVRQAQAPPKLRHAIRALAERHDVPTRGLRRGDPTAILDVVYDIQEQLFGLGDPQRRREED